MWVHALYFFFFLLWIWGCVCFYKAAVVMLILICIKVCMDEISVLIVECGLNVFDWVFVFWINALKSRYLFFNIEPRGLMLGVCRCICVWGADAECMWC